MPDLERVIEALECCTQHGSMCGLNCNGHYEYSEPDYERIVLVGNYRESCLYGKCETGCVKTLARDALALLIKREPKQVERDRQCEIAPNEWIRKGICPCCRQEIQYVYNRAFCGFCGQEVKWK